MKILILAGGSGTRLWPISRERFPKQFVKLFGEKYSLFQETFLRSLMLGSVDDVFVITNECYKHLISGEIDELGFEFNENNILVEPVAKNTLPAILAGVLESSKGKEDTIVVFPSDHKILKSREFTTLIKESKALSKTSIITFGIVPTSPNTGYGYIQPGEPVLNGYKVNAFKEKPEFEKAEEYIKLGFLWNAGIFMFNSNIFINEVREFQPHILKVFEDAKHYTQAFLNLEKGLSIDYGILEHSHKVSTVPVDIGWNDLGSFDSFFDVLDKDENKNIQNQNVISIESTGNLIYSFGNKAVAIIGLENMIVVDTKDALLICKQDESQKVKQVIDELTKRQDSRKEYHVQDYRPWGQYTILEEQKNEFKIKRILVRPGKKLSYQYHHHRSEHWVVVRGIATVVIEGVEKTLPAGESVFITVGQKHRLANNTDSSVEIIEVQLGSYLEEDDIIRLEDDFQRQ